MIIFLQILLKRFARLFSVIFSKNIFFL